jgi:hypothetical protein
MAAGCKPACLQHVVETPAHNQQHTNCTEQHTSSATSDHPNSSPSAMYSPSCPTASTQCTCLSAFCTATRERPQYTCSTFCKQQGTLMPTLNPDTAYQRAGRTHMHCVRNAKIGIPRIVLHTAAVRLPRKASLL